MEGEVDHKVLEATREQVMKDLSKAAQGRTGSEYYHSLRNGYFDYFMWDLWDRPDHPSDKRRALMEKPDWERTPLENAKAGGYEDNPSLKLNTSKYLNRKVKDYYDTDIAEALKFAGLTRQDMTNQAQKLSQLSGEARSKAEERLVKDLIEVYIYLRALDYNHHDIVPAG